MDSLDMRILSRLLNNCREPDRKIGKKLGITGSAVQARIQKMREGGVIEKFVMRVEPPVFGYGVLYFVVSGEDTGEILEQARLVGEPYFVVPCVGGITVCGVSVRDNMGQKIGLAKKLMRDFRVLTIFEAENPGFSSNLTKTDLEILGELVKDPRQRIERLAGSAGVSTKTVTRCLEKLHGNDGIQFTLIYDPRRLGRYIPHAILTWIDGDFKETLAGLNAGFSGSYLQAPFIAKNQIVLFMYSDDIYKMDEVTQRVRGSPGIRSADLFIPKKILFYDGWMNESMLDFKRSPRLHPEYQTN